MSITARLKKIERELKPKDETQLDSGQLRELVDNAFAKNKWPYLRDIPAARGKLQRLYPCNDVKIWSSEQVMLLLELSSPFFGCRPGCGMGDLTKLLAEIDTAPPTPRHIEWDLFKKAFHGRDRAACKVFQSRYPDAEPKEWASWHVTEFLKISNPWFGMSYKEMLLDIKRIDDSI